MLIRATDIDIMLPQINGNINLKKQKLNTIQCMENGVGKLIINNLKTKIQESGYTAKYLAEKVLFVHKTELSNWIAGRRKPKHDHIRILAKKLRCKMSDLYEERS